MPYYYDGSGYKTLLVLGEFEMPVDLQDMFLVKNAMPLSTMNDGERALINAIISQTNKAVIPISPNKRVNREKFSHHTLNTDPSTKGNTPTGVSVQIYYMPATAEEYGTQSVIFNRDGERICSGRRRLAVRVDSRERYSFYYVTHPQKGTNVADPNSYSFFPIDPAR